MFFYSFSFVSFEINYSALATTNSHTQKKKADEQQAAMRTQLDALAAAADRHRAEVMNDLVVSTFVAVLLLVVLYLFWNVCCVDKLALPVFCCCCCCCCC
jgi:hypothetical protein